MIGRGSTLFERDDGVSVALVDGLTWLEARVLGPGRVAQIKLELEVEGQTSRYMPEPPTCCMWLEHDDMVGVPRHYAFKKFGYTEPGQDPGSVAADFPPGIQLRGDQERCAQAVIDALHLTYGGLFQADPGFGKTVLGLEVACRLGLRTLVVVDQDDLAQQWEDQCLKFLDFRPGRMQGELCDVERPLTIATLQSLVSRRYPSDVYGSFGLVVVDEVHRLAAPTWSKAIALFPARYRLGLTATPKRFDGLEVVFRYHIGPIVAQGQNAGTLVAPTVYMVRTGTTIADLRYATRDRLGNMDNDQALITALCAVKKRTRLIVNTIKNSVAKGRNPLVLSGRVDHCREMWAMLREDGVDASLFLGSMTTEASREAKTSQVVIGTYQKAKQAVDVPRLDTLFMATPVPSVKQPVGRIQREHPGKKPPFVIDFVDEIGVGSEFSKRRERQYLGLGFTVKRS